MNDDSKEKHDFVTYFGRAKHDKLGIGCYLTLFLPLEEFRKCVKDPTPDCQMVKDRLGCLTIYFQKNNAENLLKELEVEEELKGMTEKLQEGKE